MLENYLEIDSYLPNMGKIDGISKPVKIIASDGEVYFLKSDYVYEKKEWIQLDACFFQEMFAYQIANFLEVPSPEFAIIKIEKDLLDDFPELRFEHHFKEGIYLASKSVEPVTQELKNIFVLMVNYDMNYSSRKLTEFYKSLININDLPKILFFDILTMNSDRFTNDGNIMFQKETDGLKSFSIDYGFCFFNPFWNSKIVPNTAKQALLLDTSKGTERADKIINRFNTLSLRHAQKNFSFGIAFS